MSSPVSKPFPQNDMDDAYENEFYEYASDAPHEHTVDDAFDAPSEHTMNDADASDASSEHSMHSIDNYPILHFPQNTQNDTEYTSAQLTAYVASIINPEHPITDPTDPYTYADVMDHFMFLLCRQGDDPTSTDHDFTNIYHFLKSRPRELVPPHSKFYEFGSEYSHETRSRWVKDAAFNMLGSMNTYDRVRRDFKNTVDLFTQANTPLIPPTPTHNEILAKKEMLKVAKAQLLERLEKTRTHIASRTYLLLILLSQHTHQS